ncbi:MAG: hypothetical protein IJQ81_18530, partial [Oscillibacter sp.]|nr:hypothetical protein [Oscillibacter sp.]
FEYTTPPLVLSTVFFGNSMNTKIHAIADGSGNPVVFLLSPGNDHDSIHAVELMKMTDITGANTLGDKA